jgi:hypothetical protein
LAIPPQLVKTTREHFRVKRDEILVLIVGARLRSVKLQKNGKMLVDRGEEHVKEHVKKHVKKHGL